MALSTAAPVLVAGGGLAGLTARLAFKKLGVACELIGEHGRARGRRVAAWPSVPLLCPPWTW